MKTRFILLSLVLVLLIASTIAEASIADGVVAARKAGLAKLKQMPTLQKAVAARAAAPTMLVVGQGIAVSPEDSNDFKIVKLGIGKLKLLVDDKENTTALGVAYVDDKAYRLYNIATDGDTLTGEIYTKDKNYVGKFSVTKTIKNLPLNKAQIIWVGTFEGDAGKTYYLYLHGKTVARPSALISGIGKLKEYCAEKSNDDRCKAIAKKITNYCVNNETDARCRIIALGIFRNCKDEPTAYICQQIKGATASYCRDHSDDERCLWAEKRIHKFCAESPAHAWCSEESANICDNNPDDTNCQAAIASPATTIAEPVVNITDTVTPEGEQPLAEASA